uniref:Uncharacterized protein n=1 Tax=Romanomermis culicivorax TaxID=13658 RepID=A0A915JNV3_ROMCU
MIDGKKNLSKIISTKPYFHRLFVRRLIVFTLIKFLINDFMMINSILDHDHIPSIHDRNQTLSIRGPDYFSAMANHDRFLIYKKKENFSHKPSFSSKFILFSDLSWAKSSSKSKRNFLINVHSLTLVILFDRLAELEIDVSIKIDFRGLGDEADEKFNDDEPRKEFF